MASSITTPVSPPASDAQGFAMTSSEGRLSSRQYTAIAALPGNLGTMAASPVTTPALSSASPTTASVSARSSPDDLRGRNPPSILHVDDLRLPEPTYPPSSFLPSSSLPNHRSYLSDSMSPFEKPGIMRRLSGKAHRTANNMIRRRTSSNNVAARDESSGPVIMRRRSGSKTGFDAEPSAYDSNATATDDELPFENVPGIQGLQIFYTNDTSPQPSRKQSYEDPIAAPIIPGLLQAGTTLLKVTKRRKLKNVRFKLDALNAKVTWGGSTPNSKKRFCIDDIIDIRLKHDARNYREEFEIDSKHEPTWFTIIYADRDSTKEGAKKNIHLIAPTPHVFNLWTKTLWEISKYRHQLSAGMAGPSQDETLLREHWRLEMKKMFPDGREHFPEDECLDLKAIEKMCSFHQINCSKKEIRAKFAEADSRKEGRLTFDDFRAFIRHVKKRDEVKYIFELHTAGSPGGFELATFFRFLEEVQGINIAANMKYWEDVFQKYVNEFKAPSLEGISSSTSLMGLGGFTSFLASTDNRIGSEPGKFEMDLTKPLNQYFISSSHNTYLVGRQVRDSSDIEMYSRVLQKGCRCVEIDCWDGANNKPIVKHGHAFTTSVTFHDCLTVINRFAFEATDFPLFLSLEVHCNPLQQQVMVDNMKSVFGSKLVTEAIMTNSFHLPSPEDLRGRILIKVKAANTTIADAFGNTDPTSVRRARSASSPGRILPTYSTMPLSYTSHSVDTEPMSPVLRETFNLKSSSSSDDSDSGNSPNSKPKNSRKGKNEIIPALGNLGVYARGIKFPGFERRESKTSNHIFSLKEESFAKLVEGRTKHELVDHNIRCLMRVYPSPRRLFSSNFNPLAGWKQGAQMVALNWQTYDIGMQINDAMFANYSDRSGYVLKPADLRPQGSPNDPATRRPVEETKPRKLKKKSVRFSVDLISAQSLPRPRGSSIDSLPNPYVEIEMFVADNHAMASVKGGKEKPYLDYSSTDAQGAFPAKRSTIVRQNGYNPIFNDNFKLSLETMYPDLVFVRWTVWNSLDGRTYKQQNDADPQAVFTAKLSTLDTGYRHLPLYDTSGDQYLFSTLFCKIMKEEQVDVQTSSPATPEKERESRLRKILKKTRSSDKKAPSN